MYQSPNQFSDMANTPFGRSLWEFLNQRECIIRMSAVSEVRRPAVEGVSRLLLEKYKDRVREDRCKQMVGNMIRQIMEKNGFEHSTHNIKVRFGDLFTKGSRYSMK